MAHRSTPLPLAFSRTGDTYRQWAVDRLVEQGRPFRIAYTSYSMAGIRGAVLSGLAVSAMAKSSMTPGMRALTVADGFPEMPLLRICLMTSAHSRTEPVQALEAFLIRSMQQRSGGIAERRTPPPRRTRR